MCRCTDVQCTQWQFTRCPGSRPQSTHRPNKNCANKYATQSRPQFSDEFYFKLMVFPRRRFSRFRPFHFVYGARFNSFSVCIILEGLEPTETGYWKIVLGIFKYFLLFQQIVFSKLWTILPVFNLWKLLYKNKQTKLSQAGTFFSCLNTSCQKYQTRKKAHRDQFFVASHILVSYSRLTKIVRIGTWAYQQFNYTRTNESKVWLYNLQCVALQFANSLLNWYSWFTRSVQSYKDGLQLIWNNFRYNNFAQYFCVSLLGRNCGSCYLCLSK